MSLSRIAATVRLDTIVSFQTFCQDSSGFSLFRMNDNLPFRDRVQAAVW
jgi:hypothetical protein